MIFYLHDFAEDRPLHLVSRVWRNDAQVIVIHHPRDILKLLLILLYLPPDEIGPNKYDVGWNDKQKPRAHQCQQVHAKIFCIAIYQMKYE